MRAKTITAIVQTPDGYLWLGTYDGLIRFDGVNTTTYNSANVTWHDSGVTSLYVAPDGTLWIGHERGGVTSLRDGAFTYYPPRQPRPIREIQALASDAQGDVWALDRLGGLRRVRDGLEIPPQGADAEQALGMARSTRGDIWVSSGNRLYELAGTRLQPIPLRDGMTSPTAMRPWVQGLGASSDGGFWVVANGRLWKRKDGQWSEPLADLSILGAPISALLEASDHRLYVCTPDNGIAVLEPGEPMPQRLFATKTKWASDWVLSACEDHEGGIWVGTGGAGMFKLQETRVTMLTPPDNWENRPVLTVCPAGPGGFWVGTEGAGLYRLRPDGTWRHFSHEAGYDNVYIWSVYEDPRSTVWVGSWSMLGTQDGDWFHQVKPANDVPTPIFTMVPSRRGGFWIGGRPGIARYHDGNTDWLEPKATAKLLDVKAILEQEDGTLWVSCDGEGLGEVRNGKIRQFLHRDGLGSDFVKGLLLDRDGALWIGTRDGGINRFKDGRFSVISTANGLADDTVSQIEDDGLGYLWMSTRRGIIRVSKAELNACADGKLAQVKCLAYGLSDGLNTLTCSPSQQFPGCRTANGDLVFAMDRGLAVIDPRQAKLNVLPPPVVIRSVRVADKVVSDAVDSPRTLTIGPGPNRVEIEYTGLSFAAPERMRFKHRLEGIDRDWINVGTDRRAVYNYIAPGHYVFRVTAANSDNVWNPVGATLDIEVLPHVWQTWWFRSLALCLLLAATAGIAWVQARYKLIRSLEALKLARAVDAERSRIAHDMHDDLGAHLTQIVMLSETARTDLGDPTRTEETLGRIYETTRNITRAMDEIVWAINPRHDTLESLVSYCERFAQDLLAAAGIACRFDVPLDMPAWSATSEVRHNLFLAYKEILHNAVRHAGASTVTISLQTDAAGLRFVIADNGRGLPSENAPKVNGSTDRIACGHGLASIRARMGRIGGRCEIESAPGRGCVVVLSLPAQAFRTLKSERALAQVDA